MKARSSLAFWLLLSATALRAAEPPCDYADWAAEEKSFAEKLGALVESNRASQAAFADQLRDRRHTAWTPVLAPAAPEPVPTPGQMYRQARASVVAVGGVYNCGRCDHWHINAATGFVVGENGIIATNHHVLDKDEKTELIGVRLEDGRVFPALEILASDPRADVALFRIAATGLRPLPLGGEVDIGDPVFVISHPVGAYYTLTSGLVSNKFRGGRRRNPSAEFSITADFAKGSSGGPILSPRGEVLGLVRATVSTYYEKDRNLQMVWKYVVPVAALRDLAAEPETSAVHE
jgi:S1-C subfamily serine protease